jgi:hypothetical protein
MLSRLKEGPQVYLDNEVKEFLDAVPAADEEAKDNADREGYKFQHSKRPVTKWCRL